MYSWTYLIGEYCLKNISLIQRWPALWWEETGQCSGKQTTIHRLWQDLLTNVWKGGLLIEFMYMLQLKMFMSVWVNDELKVFLYFYFTYWCFMLFSRIYDFFEWMNKWLPHQQYCIQIMAGISSKAESIMVGKKRTELWEKLAIICRFMTDLHTDDWEGHRPEPVLNSQLPYWWEAPG